MTSDLRWFPGPQTVVPGNRNNAMLQNLLPDTPYNITVEALYAEGPGGALNGNGRTVGMLSPRNLRVSDEWYTRFRVAWDPVAAPVQGYRLVYTPAGEPRWTGPGEPAQVNTGQVLVALWCSDPPLCLPGSNQPMDFFVGDVTSYTLHNLLPGTTYDLQVAAQYGGGLSGALAGDGTTRTYRSWTPRPGPLPHAPGPETEAGSKSTGFTQTVSTMFKPEESNDSSVYLNVTNIETYGADHDKFCIKWTSHRAATSYRIKLRPLDRESPPSYLPTGFSSSPLMCPPDALDSCVHLVLWIHV
ncbi:Collagen alpha-1(XII) chain [Liparis tanakae]|uniref:Collagen alpha-1(XII) chain n=1 Tax=Liparis tanakae TaxID=230148 RepID=A0A4Z2EWY4_9TELE|nr:Collagen alpha-1(XII) chain [Liparis tanakae]